MREAPRIEIAPDPEALARTAAAEIARRAAAAPGPFSLALAGGSTPRRTYELLGSDPLRGEVPWGRLQIFFGDERCVPPDSPDSNYGMARAALLSRVPLPEAGVHRMRGEDPDADGAAAAYEEDLRGALGGRGLDLVLLGMGEDGHVASLFPGGEALGEARRLVRAAAAPAPPLRRITLTLPALQAAAAIVFLVAGAGKAERVAEVLGGRAPWLPAARAQPARGEALWLLDAAAASRLPLGRRRRGGAPAPAGIRKGPHPPRRTIPMNALALAALCLTASATAGPPLRVSAIPDEAPTELIRKFKPLGEYLEKALGREVKFTPVTDYPATVEGLAAGSLDLVWYGGFTFVQARRRTGNAIPLVQREEDARFHSKFIARAGSGITRLQDLKGKTVAFGSPSSTSGHLMPRYFLLQAGLVPERDFARVAFSGAHDATAKWVESGKVDAGALNESVWQKLVEEGKVDASKLVAFYTTPEFFDYNWTVRGDLDPGLVERIRAAFLALDYRRPEDRAVLDLQRTRRFIPTRPENYAMIEQAARSADLLK